MTAIDLWVGTSAMVDHSAKATSWADCTWGIPHLDAVGEHSATPTSTSSTPCVTPPLSSAPSPHPARACKYFAAGGCTRGDACTFSHDLTISAATDADVSRGFVLTGQVVNLQSAQAKQPQKSHAMNPDALPFVAPNESEAGAYTADYHTAAYLHNTQLAPLTYRSHDQHYSDNRWEHTDRSMHHHDVDTFQADAYSYGTDSNCYHGYHDNAAYVDDIYAPTGYAQVPRWTPSGVFSTTADSAATKSALAGFYDHMVLGNQDDSAYQHRRLQALRPPLERSKAKSNGAAADDDAPAAQLPTTWTRYPRPTTENHVYHSAETHRKLRNRHETH